MQDSSSDILTRRYRRNPDLIQREIAGEFVLVPIRHDMADLEAIYTLEGVGARIWEWLDGEQDGYAILARIVNEYDVSEEVARQDLIEFLQQLDRIEGILPADSPDAQSSG